ncbi:MAG: hypothetical protein GY929_02495, partial [Actinomycetia bacterium]|nr:hypothetical protein [Actinomycetes bacterium]
KAPGAPAGLDLSDLDKAPGAPAGLDLSDLDKAPGAPAGLDLSDLDKVPAVAASVDLTGPPPPPPPTAPTTGEATVAELVQGITMPSDLVPLTHTGPSTGDHVVLMSTTADAAAVGPALADALEEIGMTIEPVSGNEIIASRYGHGSMHAAIHINPTTVLRAAGPAFPTAPAGSVVVELWTGPRPE